MSIALRRLAIVALSLAVFAGGAGGVVARQNRVADADPHDGVARAHTMPVQGIDVSNWQGDIDWDKVRAAGTQFAFIKATEGGDYLDPKFARNWLAAKRVGIPRGAYHMVYWCRAAHEQALWFILNVPNDPDALPPVLDLEWNGHSRSCPKRIPTKLALEKIKIMLEVMESHTGKRPIIYTDITFHKEILEGEYNDYPYWIRSTAAEPQVRYENRRWTFWQFTTTGRVPGVRGDVDRNTFYGTENQWRMFVQSACDPRDHGRLKAQGVCRDMDTVQTASIDE